MDAGLGYPHCEIEVGGHRLRVYLNRMLTVPPRTRFEPLEDLRFKGAKLMVYLICCGRLGTCFRARHGRYYMDKRCPVCNRQKTEVFFYRDLRPLLPAEWELPATILN